MDTKYYLMIISYFMVNTIMVKLIVLGRSCAEREAIGTYIRLLTNLI